MYKVEQRGLRIATLFLFCTIVLQQADVAHAIGKRQVKGRASSSKLPSVVRRVSKVGKPEKRSCKIYNRADPAKSRAIEFKCRTKSETGDSAAGTKEKIDDEVKFKIKSSSDGPIISVDYKQQVKWNERETETKTQYVIKFGSVIEYAKRLSAEASYGGVSTSVTERDADGDSIAVAATSPEYEDQSRNVEDDAYDYEYDEVVQSMPLSDWLDFSEITTEKDGDEFHFDLSSPDGMVWFGFTISQADPPADDRTGRRNSETTTEGEDSSATSGATANKMKIDFRLSSFPWKRDDTYVALLSTVESEMKVKVKYEEDSDKPGKSPKRSRVLEEPKKKPKKPKEIRIPFEEAVSVTGIVPFGDFTWAKEAEAVPDTSSGGDTDVVTAPDDGSIVSQSLETDGEGDSGGEGTKDEEGTVDGETRVDGEAMGNGTEAVDGDDTAFTDGGATGNSTGEIEGEGAVDSDEADKVVTSAGDGGGEEGTESTANATSSSSETSDRSGEAMRIRVVATSPDTTDDEMTQSIAFSFVGGAARHASEIDWDPQAGVGYDETDDTSDSSSIFLSHQRLSTRSLVTFVVGALIALF